MRLPADGTFAPQFHGDQPSLQIGRYRYALADGALQHKSDPSVFWVLRSAAGDRQALCYTDGLIRIEDRGRSADTIRHQTQPAHAASFSGDGLRLAMATADGCIRVWDCGSDQHRTFARTATQMCLDHHGQHLLVSHASGAALLAVSAQRPNTR